MKKPVRKGSIIGVPSKILVEDEIKKSREDLRKESGNYLFKHGKQVLALASEFGNYMLGLTDNSFGSSLMIH